MDTSSGNTMWEPPSPEELQAMLPQYEITAILGRGGMGAVYKGRQTKLNRNVAIKLLPETLVQSEDEMNFAARFEQEAQAMANLDHPAIVSVHDFGETEAGQCYFVMEFIDGMDIHQYLQANGGKLSQENALAIASHVLDALEYAHSRGIIHRDIKPANVLLNQEGRVKIADFGLAKKIADGESDLPALTMSNVALGTPDFVAPESLDGSRIPDHRADLYAVGVMLYQMLTGSLPRGQFKTPSELRPEVDFRLDEIVSRAMQTDPDDRYGSATEIRSALDLVASEPVTKVEVIEEEENAPVAVPKKTVSPAKKSNAGLWTALAVGAVVIAVLAVVMMPGEAEEKTVAIADIPEEKESPPVEEPSKNEPDPEPVAPKPEPPKPVAVVETPEPAAPTPVEPEKVEAPVVAEAVAESKPAPADTPAKPEAPKKEVIPELGTRLDGYLAARQKAVLDLASKYERALTARTNAAADAGDLPLVKAYRSEADHLTKLKTHLEETGSDPFARIKESATLPDLDTDAPESLVQLRQTWTAERAKIKTNLDQKLLQSLVAAEKQLTQAREFDKAETILAFRQTLDQPAAIAATEPEPTPPTEPAPAVPDSYENPYGWKDIPDDPFPLQIPARPTTPGRVVAFRADGKPVDETHFREVFGGVPGDLGEVVDIDTFPNIAADSKEFLLMALRPDGNLAAMRWKTAAGGNLGENDERFHDIVSISLGRFAFAALRADGTVVTAEVNPGAWDKQGTDLKKTEEWTDMVRISAGDYLVAGLTSAGEPRFAGDNRGGQQNMPPDWQSGVFAIDVKNEGGVSVLVKQIDDKIAINKFGAYPHENTIDPDQRFFLNLNPYITDSSGRFESDDIPRNFTHSIEDFRGAKPRDIVWMSRADPNLYTDPAGIAAACDGDGEWTYWGSADTAGDFDAEYCEEKTRGAWKAYVLYPYVVALKPASAVTAGDWTGSAATDVTTAKPEAPAPTASAAVSGETPKFPLSIPARPSDPGYVIVLRRDGKPIDPETEHPVAIIPEELGSSVVQLAVSHNVPGSDCLLAVALLEDGKVRMWGGAPGQTHTNEQLADRKNFSTSNIVRVSAGAWGGLFLDDKGRLFGTGGAVGVSFDQGIERIRLAENVVDVENRSSRGFALLESGKVVAVTKMEHSTEILEQFPRSVDIISVYGAIALGEDLTWRGFLAKEPTKLSAEFPSEGLIGEPSAYSNNLMWIGGDGKVRANYVDQSTKPDNFSLLPKYLGQIADPIAVYKGSGMEAVKSASKGWVVRDGAYKDAVDFTTIAKDAIAIESTADYFFALMPGDRKE